ncbi:hypothetical protein HK098_007252 [Nowakowskiella sp. JEL0407]|nr:hypothetical protein HK098_007252 [Nowakowskiella sp. JEL0407]
MDNKKPLDSFIYGSIDEQISTTHPEFGPHDMTYLDVADRRLNLMNSNNKRPFDHDESLTVQNPQKINASDIRNFGSGNEPQLQVPLNLSPYRPPNANMNITHPITYHSPVPGIYHPPPLIPGPPHGHTPINHDYYGSAINTSTYPQQSMYIKQESTYNTFQKLRRPPQRQIQRKIQPIQPNSQIDPTFASSYIPRTLNSENKTMDNVERRAVLDELNLNGRKFDLEIVQQSLQARMCGFGDVDRRVIDPLPVLEILIKNEDGQRQRPLESDEEVHRLMVRASLCKPNLETIYNNMQSPFLLVGNTTATPLFLTEATGETSFDVLNPDAPRCLVVFTDLSIRSMAPSSPLVGKVLKKVYSTNITVYRPKDFPGVYRTSTLSTALASTGLKIANNAGRRRIMDAALETNTTDIASAPTQTINELENTNEPLSASNSMQEVELDGNADKDANGDGNQKLNEEKPRY